MNRLRVLVVDDSAAMRRILRIVLGEDAELEVQGAAAHGKIALAMLAQNVPDIVTLDIEMPEMDGLATLVHLRERYPKLPVIMFSTLSERGAAATLDALARGANDYATKPVAVADAQEAIRSIREQLIPKIKALCRRQDGVRELRVLQVGQRVHGSRVELVAIGSSTGGPNALGEVLAAIPADFPVPIVVVQHMPPVFTRLLAERLAKTCALPVREAVAGGEVRAGELWIAAGDYHLAVKRTVLGGQMQLLQTPAENSCRPSVDVLFRSAAQAYGGSVLAVVMTGMGQDGLRGAQDVRAAGGRVWAQDAETSVVWGMPGYVVHAGLAERVLPLRSIGPEIARVVVEAHSRIVAEAVPVRA